MSMSIEHFEKEVDILMKNLFTKMNKIIETKGGDEVRGAILVNDYSGRKEIIIMIKSFMNVENGKRHIKYSELLRFNYEIYQDNDLEEKLKPLLRHGNLIDEKDVRKIAVYIMENWKDLNKIFDKNKVDFTTICRILYESKEGEIELNNRKYIILSTASFNEIARNSGWIPIHLKKTLILSDMLYRNMGRYDYHRRENESRVICIDKELLEGEINDAEI